MTNESKLCVFFCLILLVGCNIAKTSPKEEIQTDQKKSELNLMADRSNSIGALLLTRYSSMEELSEVVDISYRVEPFSNKNSIFITPRVQLTHISGKERVVSILRKGVDESDFNRARDGDIIDLLLLVLKTPFAVINKQHLVSIELLGRRRYEMFGEGDIAFYDLAEQMVKNIKLEYLDTLYAKDMSEKGYLNTFNHITAQAIITAAFSEQLADYVADVHERYTLPELITGEFTTAQLTDLEKGPVDNYVDMINNEWGQELGKRFRKNHNITFRTKWTTTTLANALNYIQMECGYALNIQFRPFRETDEMIIRFVDKFSKTDAGVSKYIQYYYDRVKLNMEC